MSQSPSSFALGGTLFMALLSAHHPTVTHVSAAQRRPPNRRSDAEQAGAVRNAGGRCAPEREDHEGGACRGRRVCRAPAAAGAAGVGRLHDTAGVLPRGGDRVANARLGDQVRGVAASRRVEWKVRRRRERRFRRHDILLRHGRATASRLCGGRQRHGPRRWPGRRQLRGRTSREAR